MAPSTSLRVLLQRNPSFARSGPKSYARALRKYNIQPTKPGPYYMASRSSTNSSATHEQVLMKQVAGDDTVPAEDIEHDSEYICPVAIGTPAQTLQLDFDTGSADLWVFSNKLSSSVLSRYGASHAVFDPSQSSSFQNSAQSTWQIRYGDNSSASGVVGTDTVSLGSISIKEQAVELADTLSLEFASGRPDGLLGLAWPSINTVKPAPVQTMVANMISQGAIPQPIFTCYLSSSKGTDKSFYTFGHIDQDALAAANATEADIYYTPIDNTQGFWQFASGSATVDGQPVTTTGNTAIADTGTTLALVSDAVCEAVYAAIAGAKYDPVNQGWVFPATVRDDELPAVQVDMGGRLFTINKSNLGYVDLGNGFVYGGIQSRGSLGFDILGDTFLKSVYAVFDQGGARFGAVQRRA